MTTLVLEFIKIESDNSAKYSTFYSNSKAETVINESDINHTSELIFSTIISNTKISLDKDSGWIIDSVIKHNLLASSSHIKLLKESNHLKQV